MNTVVSGLMEYNNKINELANKAGALDPRIFEDFSRLLAPLAPHMAEELWELLGHKDSVFAGGWPEYDESAMVKDVLNIPIQINGKMKGVVELPKGCAKDEAIATAKAAVKDKLPLDNIVKEIFVQDKIINFVVRS